MLSFDGAVLGVLRSDLYPGAPPSQSAFRLLGVVARGAATLADSAPMLAARARRSALERARLAKRRVAQPRAG